MTSIVVAGGIIWQDDHLLAALRPQGKPMAGYWEFPGGKLEPGETAEQALCRELREELGISVRALMNANPNIAAGHLLVGDILCVPVGEGRSCPVGSSAYTVQQGQSVVDVMLSSNVSLRALREYNEDIRLTALRPGDVLCVPPSGDRGLCENGGPVYRLQEGDTLDEIAERNGTNVEQLLRLNPNLLPSDFVSGQVICLPTRRRVTEENTEEQET